MTKPRILSQKPRSATVALAILAIVLVSVTVYRSVVYVDSQDIRTDFLSRIKSGVGTEVHLGTPSSSQADITASVDSVASFIYGRSGIALSADYKAKLANIEMNVLRNTSGTSYRRITAASLVDILTTTAIERLSSLTNSEISRMADVLNGFTSADLPESFRNDWVRLRWDNASRMTKQEFIQELQSRRDATDKTETENGLRTYLQGIVDQRLRDFSEALSGQFAATGLTPVEAVLVAYSIAGDDLLADSQSGLVSTMQEMATSATNQSGGYPNPSGHFAYGVNGYLYSSPLDITFSGTMFDRFLARIEERSRVQ